MENNQQEDLKMDDIFTGGPVIDIEEDAEILFQEESQEENNNPPEVDAEGDKPDETKNDSLENVVGDESQEQEDNNDNPNNDDNPSPNIFSSLAALLKEKNLLSSPDIDIKTEEDFVNAFKGQIEQNEYLDLTDSQKAYLKALRDGVPDEDIKKHISTSEQLDSITEEKIEEDSVLRQRIIYNDLLNKGFTQEKAIKFVERSVKMEVDTEDAKEALESIKNFKKESFKKQQEEQLKQKQEREKVSLQRVERIKNKIKNTEEIIKGYKISDNIKESMEKNMFDITNVTEDGTEENSLMKYARENKDDFDLKLYYLFTITNGFQDFSTIEKTKNSKILNDLEKAIKSNTRIKDPSIPAYLQDSESYDIEIKGHELVID